jgi:hypothetical protein
MGQADEIAKQSGATIVTPAELGTYFQLAGVPAPRSSVARRAARAPSRGSSTRSCTHTMARGTPCPTSSCGSTGASTPGTS